MAVTVNGEGVTVAEFQAQVAQYKNARTALGTPEASVGSDEATKAVLEDMIAQVLLAQGARSAGFVLTDSALQSKVDALVTKIGGEDKLTKWQSNHGYTPASFLVALKRSAEAAWMRDKIVTAVPRTADQVHVQQILLYNEGDANAVLEQLKIGGDFNALAAQYDPNPRRLGLVPEGLCARARHRGGSLCPETRRHQHRDPDRSRVQHHQAAGARRQSSALPRCLSGTAGDGIEQLGYAAAGHRNHCGRTMRVKISALTTHHSLSSTLSRAECCNG